jgi:ATP-binding cassette, subfamily G (WHITE), member 2, PDR
MVNFRTNNEEIMLLICLEPGIHSKDMHKRYKGEIVYNSEADNHFPHLTVRQTLQFAATLRTNHNRVVAKERSENARRVTEVVMNVLGLSAVQNTVVGNDFVRGVSGGERKVRSPIIPVHYIVR